MPRKTPAIAGSGRVLARNVGRSVADLGDGRMAAPGGDVLVDPTDPHVAGLLETRQLKPVTQPASPADKE